jgi:flagella basal body P-ring formation protein FlgA
LALAPASWGAADKAGDKWHSLDDIKATAASYLEARVGKAAGNTHVEAGFLDPRLKLASCSVPLEAFLNRGARIRHATTVGVRCSGGQRWKVYVPVSIVTTAVVAVAARHLPPGSAIAADSIRFERRDVTRNRKGFYTALAAVEGFRVTRPLMAGQVLAPDALAADNVIRRGQTVTLTVANAALRINMSGKALADGAIGQRIKVENSSSGRVVEGVVRSREHVEILVATPRDFFSAKAKGSAPVADTRLSNNDR